MFCIVAPASLFLVASQVMDCFLAHTIVLHNIRHARDYTPEILLEVIPFWRFYTRLEYSIYSYRSRLRAHP